MGMISADADAPPAPGRSRSPSLVTAVVLLAGVLLGALLGGIIFASQASYSASALVQAGPVVLGGANQNDPATAYVNSELVFIDTYSAGMAQAAADATGDPGAAPVTVNVQSGTSILSFDATASSSEDAAKVANASAQYYVDQWRERTLGLIDRSLDIIDGQLADAPPCSTCEATLEVQQSDLNTQRASVASAERIVSSADPDAAAQSPSPLGGALLGALVGLVVAIAVLMLRERRRASQWAGHP